MNLEHTVSQIQAAETEADGVEILREAIEKLIKDNEPKSYEVDPILESTTYKAGYNDGIDQYKDFLLASIQPKEMK